MESNARATKKQQALLAYVDGFIHEQGYGPSYREIMNALGYKSVSTVAVHVEGLIAKGFLKRKDNSARSLEVAGLSSHDVATTDEILLKLTTVYKASEQSRDQQAIIRTMELLGYQNEADSLRN